MTALEGRVVMVTGSTDGLGQGLATELAGSGATVLAHGRSDERLEALRAQLERAGEARAYRADFASLDEVRSLADEVLAAEPRLDVLVLNAGIGTTVPGGGRRMTSADGYELRFAVNYLAPFLLTRLLEPLVLRSAPARVVSVSSAGQMPIAFSDVMLEHEYSGVRAYCQSKLAQVMFTLDLADELRGRGVTATCLHPATYMPTKMVTGAGVTPASTLEDGVCATLRLVADPQLESVTGVYFDGLVEARAIPQAYDPLARARLRRLSEELTALPSAAG